MTIWHIGAYIEDVYLQVPRLPREGESLSISQVDRSPGGKASNQAFATARLGTPCQLIAAVGEDGAARRGLGQLGSVGVGLDHVMVVDAATDESTIVLDENAQQFILTWAGAGQHLTSQHVLTSLDQLQTGDIVSLQGEISPQITRDVIAHVQDRATVVLNPSPVDAFLTDAHTWQGIDILVVNETEAAALTGQNEVTNPAGMLKELAAATGVGRCVITLGERGAMCLDQGVISQFAAPRVNAIDPTGAGDGFTAGLIHKLAQGQSLAQGCEFGVQVGAFATEHKHCFPGYPDQHQLDSWLRDHPGLHRD